MRLLPKIVVALLLALILMPSLAFGWTQPRLLPSGAYSTDPRAIAIGSNIYAIEWVASGDFNFLSSTDNGYSWSSPVQPADTFYDTSISPDIGYTPNGLIHVVWAGRYQGIPWASFIFHQSSSDGGRHWSNRHRVFNSNSIDANYPCLTNKGDTLFLVVAMNLGWVVFRSFNSGSTWQDSAFVDSTEVMSQPPILQYSNGRIHLIYQRGTSENGIQVCYSGSDDLGLTWTPRIYLSDASPPYHANQDPAAYADEDGHIVATWYSYKYGSMCGVNGDILGKISTNNGDSWLPETRLTNTQSGDYPDCLIIGDTVLAVWPDTWPLGCSYPKIEISASDDWGAHWIDPEIITGRAHDREQTPSICYSNVNGDLLLHCLYRLRDTLQGYGIYYIRNKPFYSDRVPLPHNQPVILDIKANPNVFNSSTLISIIDEEGGDVDLEIYDILGQRVWQKTISGKEANLIWDARDMDGNGISSGIYFVRATTVKNISTAKLLYLK